MSDKVKAALILGSASILVAIIYVVANLLSIQTTTRTTISIGPTLETPIVTTPAQTVSNKPQPDNFSINRGGNVTTDNGTTICTGDIVGPNFSPDSDPDTGEIVVSQHAGIPLQFPYGGSCTHWASNLQGNDLTNEVQAIKSSQKCRDGVQPCRSITEYDV
jgi:hypothetical protein